MSAPETAVVTTPFTFFATAGAIANVGAIPVFADIDPATLNLDPEDVRRVLKGRSAFTNGAAGVDPSRIKAVIPVHLFGLPADMDAFAAIRDEFGVAVVEDSAQAFGSTWAGHPVGGLGDIGCFSFFPTKNLGGFGDAGMVVTDSAEHGARLRLLRAHGARTKYVNEVVGMNSRMDSLQAALASGRPAAYRVVAGCSPASCSGVRRCAAVTCPTLRTPAVASGRTHHQYVDPVARARSE